MYIVNYLWDLFYMGTLGSVFTFFLYAMDLQTPSWWSYPVGAPNLYPELYNPEFHENFPKVPEENKRSFCARFKAALQEEWYQDAHGLKGVDKMFFLDTLTMPEGEALYLLLVDPIRQETVQKCIAIALKDCPKVIFLVTILEQVQDSLVSLLSKPKIKRVNKYEFQTNSLVCDLESDTFKALTEWIHHIMYKLEGNGRSAKGMEYQDRKYISDTIVRIRNNCPENVDYKTFIPEAVRKAYNEIWGFKEEEYPVYFEKIATEWPTAEPERKGEMIKWFYEFCEVNLFHQKHEWTYYYWTNLKNKEMSAVLVIIQENISDEAIRNEFKDEVVRFRREGTKSQLWEGYEVGVWKQDLKNFLILQRYIEGDVVFFEELPVEVRLTFYKRVHRLHTMWGYNDEGLARMQKGEKESEMLKVKSRDVLAAVADEKRLALVGEQIETEEQKASGRIQQQFNAENPPVALFMDETWKTDLYELFQDTGMILVSNVMTPYRMFLGHTDRLQKNYESAGRMTPTAVLKRVYMMLQFLKMQNDNEGYTKVLTYTLDAILAMARKWRGHKQVLGKQYEILERVHVGINLLSHHAELVLTQETHKNYIRKLLRILKWTYQTQAVDEEEDKKKPGCVRYLLHLLQISYRDEWRADLSRTKDVYKNELWNEEISKYVLQCLLRDEEWVELLLKSENVTQLCKQISYKRYNQEEYDKRPGMISSTYDVAYYGKTLRKTLSAITPNFIKLMEKHDSRLLLQSILSWIHTERDDTLDLPEQAMVTIRKMDRRSREFFFLEEPTFLPEEQESLYTTVLADAKLLVGNEKRSNAYIHRLQQDGNFEDPFWWIENTKGLLRLRWLFYHFRDWLKPDTIESVIVLAEQIIALFAKLDSVSPAESTWESDKDKLYFDITCTLLSEVWTWNAYKTEKCQRMLDHRLHTIHTIIDIVDSYQHDDAIELPITIKRVFLECARFFTAYWTLNTHPLWINVRDTMLTIFSKRDIILSAEESQTVHTLAKKD